VKKDSLAALELFNSKSIICFVARAIGIDTADVYTSHRALDQAVGGTVHHIEAAGVHHELDAVSLIQRSTMR
jgi:hypothetical protein